MSWSMLSWLAGAGITVGASGGAAVIGTTALLAITSLGTGQSLVSANKKKNIFGAQGVTVATNAQSMTIGLGAFITSNLKGNLF